MMGINVGKKVMMKLNRVKQEGIIPSEFEEEIYLAFGSVKEQIEKLEKQGEVICIEKKRTPYISRYALIKYAQSGR